MDNWNFVSVSSDVISGAVKDAKEWRWKQVNPITKSVPPKGNPTQGNLDGIVPQYSNPTGNCSRTGPKYHPNPHSSPSSIDPRTSHISQTRTEDLVSIPMIQQPSPPMPAVNASVPSSPYRGGLENSTMGVLQAGGETVYCDVTFSGINLADHQSSNFTNTTAPHHSHPYGN